MLVGMGRFFFVLLAFGVLVFMIVSIPVGDPASRAAMRHRVARGGLLAFEGALVAVLLIRAPFLRTPVGLVLLPPALFLLHMNLARSLSTFLVERGWAPPPARTAPGAGAGRGLPEPERLVSRYFYVGLFVLYGVVVALVYFIRRWVAT